MATITRTSEVVRKTRETDIAMSLVLDGSGNAEVSTGLGFLDHMLTALAFWARFDLTLRCDGDLHVDDHHTVEDVALCLGQAIDQALGDRRGIERFGQAFAPMDEALVRCAVDLSGRSYCVAQLGFERPMIGDVATENITHFFGSLATTARANLHIDLIRGANDHHRAEAAFKATALALRQAVAVTGVDISSTKGAI